MRESKKLDLYGCPHCGSPVLRPSVDDAPLVDFQYPDESDMFTTPWYRVVSVTCDSGHTFFVQSSLAFAKKG